MIFLEYTILTHANQVGDRVLRSALSRLLWQNGAIVYCADNDEEMAQLAEIIGFDLAIISVEPMPEFFQLELKILGKKNYSLEFRKLLNF